MQKPVNEQSVNLCFLAVFKSEVAMLRVMPHTSLDSLVDHESFCFAHRLQLLLPRHPLSHRQKMVVLDA